MKAEFTDPIAPVRDRILEAGQIEFAAHGLRGASVHVIAGRAGVTAAMINYYFGGKQALYERVILEAGGRLAERLMIAATDGTPEDVAASLIGAYFDFLVEAGTFQRLLIREIIDRPGAAIPLAREYLLPIRDFLEVRFGAESDAVHPILSLVGAVGAWFLYAPVLGAVTGSDPVASDALASRRNHVIELARLLYRKYGASSASPPATTSPSENDPP